jgi:hypothetical protein
VEAVEQRERVRACEPDLRYTRKPAVTFTIEFIRVRESDNAHATLDRVTNVGADLDEVKVRAKDLFATLDLPQAPDAVRILDEEGRELFFWSPGARDT